MRDLAPRLDLDGLADEADRVDVLDLAAGAEFLAGAADRHVHVGAEIALLHVAVAGAEIAQDRAQLGHIGARLVRRAQVRLRHDLHQRHARAVEVDEAQGRVQVVDRLAGILLEMQALDAHGDGLAALRHVHDHLALAHDRALVLADLVALRQVRIEVVLAVEGALQVDLGLEPEPRADGLAHAFLVDHGQHAGHGRIHQGNVAVRIAAEGRRGAGEQLGLARHLGMDLHADDDFPIACRAFDELLRVDRSVHEPCAFNSRRLPSIGPKSGFALSGSIRCFLHK